MVNNKNGFEIRLEVLKMAKDTLDQAYNATSNAYWHMVHESAEKWNKSVEEMFEQTMKMQPQMPTADEIVKQAQQLYSFIAKKD